MAKTKDCKREDVEVYVHQEQIGDAILVPMAPGYSRWVFFGREHIHGLSAAELREVANLLDTLAKESNAR